MSTEYFTKHHVDLLNKWQGQKRDSEDVEQQADYQELKRAYDIVKIWAESIQLQLFPDGRVQLRRSPVNQGGNFFSYLWAKIFPSTQSSEHLAYTVHISAEEFGVKIDTVNAPKSVIKKYTEVRGEYDQSPIVKSLDLDEGLAMTLTELVDWSVEAIQNFGLKYDEVEETLGLKDNSEKPEVVGSTNYSSTSNVFTPLNQILYGPPGTGKTYHTIEAAVKAAEPDFYLELNIDHKVGATKEQRAALQSKYQELCDAKRIRFVTFHQSYGYEEFVEGLTASSTDGQVSYDVKAGIFKAICNDARCGALVEKHTSEANFDALMEALRQHKQNQTALQTKDGKQFTITNVSESSIQVQPQDALNTKSVNVNYLRAYIESRDDIAIANHSPAYIRGITYEYDRLNSLKPERVNENYVLIIDEINRGNISKIFGELITLIEDSKRLGKGQTESIEVVLPHSGETFSVPNNLYLIGTMNTADRSLAMMDTALRRRFAFIEMMPKPSLLSGVVVRGIDLERLLETLNQRIEVLYDREHTLGHAFFMPVKECVEQGDDTQAFAVLKSVFQNKIIPLLEEYFFEDWHKIRLVLADNQKAENSQLEGLQFISEQKLTTTALGTLFGHNHGLNQYGEEQQKFTLKDKTDSVWDNPSTYIGIYSLGQASVD